MKTAVKLLVLFALQGSTLNAACRSTVLCEPQSVMHVEYLRKFARRHLIKNRNVRRKLFSNDENNSNQANGAKNIPSCHKKKKITKKHLPTFRADPPQMAIKPQALRATPKTMLRGFAQAFENDLFDQVSKADGNS